MFDTILAPVGGDGLLSGAALAAKYLSPSTEVIACEPANAQECIDKSSIFNIFNLVSFFFINTAKS